MRLSDQNKANIEIIKSFLLTSDNDYSKLFNTYQKQIQDLNELNIEDKFLKEKIKKIIDKEMDDFQKQVGNKIIKSLLKAYEESNKNAFKSISSFGNFFQSFMNIFRLNRSE
jgi:ICEF-II ORF3